jgi:hypothetical protein
MERQLRLPGTLSGAPCLDHATLVRLLRKPGTQDIKGEREHETVQPAQIPEKSNRTLTTTTKIRVPPPRRAQSFGRFAIGAHPTQLPHTGNREVGAEKSRGGPAFPVRLIGNDQNLAENTRVRDDEATAQTFNLFRIARRCKSVRNSIGQAPVP